MTMNGDLDVSGVQPSIMTRLKNSASMLEFNEIASIKRCEYPEGTIMPSYGVQKENMFDRYQESDHGPDDNDDFCFIDIESEIQIPLNDEESSSSHSNDNIRIDSTHRCLSMSDLKSSALNNQLVEKINQSQHSKSIGAEGSLKRVDSQSILKSSPAYIDVPEDQMRRRASFGTLEIREYPITLGDNPGGVQGPPVSLDWKHNEKRTKVIPLDAYEDTRAPRRDRREMYMADNLRRWRLLRENGYTMDELNRACSAAENVRRQRRKSLKPQATFSKIKKSIVKMIGSSNNELGRYTGSLG